MCRRLNLIVFAAGIPYNLRGMNPLKYLWAYFETNHFTAYFSIFLIVLSLIKYFKLPSFPAKKALFAIVLLGLALRIAWLGFSSYEPKTQWNPTHMLES